MGDSMENSLSLFVSIGCTLFTITIRKPKYNLLTNFSTLITILAIVCRDTMLADFSAPFAVKTHVSK